jgi:hypothetical protein
MRIPGASGFGVYVGEACARRRIRNADQNMAAGTFNLASGVAGIAFQGLVAMGTVEFEIRVTHILTLNMRKRFPKSMWK